MKTGQKTEKFKNFEDRKSDIIVDSLQKRVDVTPPLLQYNLISHPV